MQELHDERADAAPDWDRVRPVLDEAMGELNEGDREAILLRFFEGRNFADVGARLNVSDNTARMRVERALDKLHGHLERRGVTSTQAALAAALAHQAVLAAPAGLATAIAAAVHLGGGAAGGTVLGLMSLTKLQLGIAGALVAAGVTGVVLQSRQRAELSGEVARLQQENAAIAPLQAENLRLQRRAIEVSEMRRDDAEFRRLEDEAKVLRTRLQQVARAEQVRAATAGPEPYDIAQLDQAPRARFQARPRYPAEMRQAGVAGEVVVDFVVDAAGEVQRAQALRSSRRDFEAAAVEAVSQWKFNPGKKGGRDVATRLQVPIVFTLGSGVGAGAPSDARAAPDAFRVKTDPAPGSPAGK
jgi:TonB family protein